MQMFLDSAKNLVDSFQIHYYFNDETHTIDAVIQNQCEKEFLEIVNQLGKNFEINIEILIEPLANGGLKRRFKIIEKNAKKYPVTAGLLVVFLTTLFVKPIDNISSKLINKFFEDNVEVETQKRILQKQERNLDVDFILKVSQLPHNNIIKKRISNFYENLDKYPKVKKVSFQKMYDNIEVGEENIVSKSSFNKFILPSNDLEPVEKEDVIIEIISPVLKKGKYKWRGIYNGEIISFNMNSKEYKAKVQSGEVQFVNGSSIKADVEITMYLDSEGHEKTKSFTVNKVSEYFDQDKPIETEEGKNKRKFKEAQKQILKFDFGEDFN